MSFFSRLPPIKLPANYEKLEQWERRHVRQAYEAKQHNLCYHCQCALSGEPSFDVVEIEVSPDLFPSGFFDNPIHLHHNHDTGMTIGAVHAHCNAVMWEHYGE